MKRSEIVLAAADRLAALDKAATPGPWEAIGAHIAKDTGQCTCGSAEPYGHEQFCGVEDIGQFASYEDGTSPDVDLMAALRMAAPFVVTLLRTHAPDLCDVADCRVCQAWVDLAESVPGRSDEADTATPLDLIQDT